MTNVGSADEARARFARATAEHLGGELVPGVTIEQAAVDEWQRWSTALWDAAHRRPLIDVGRLQTAEERQAMADLDAVFGAELEHRLLLRAGDEVIGAYWGQQQAWARYYMVSSVVHPAWQGRGLYRALLARVMATAAASGFREIYSRHRADNNAVLVPKLKAGFTIGAFEIVPRWGLLVHLRYYPSEAVRMAYQHRVDGSHVDELRARGALT